ncbi:ABC transporter permease [Rhabdochromatium marinum]|uniref:ABC transporter permease n=1 Tax=Rhabdochromatium marinum TaxID=48729 RepID=UPI0019044B80|nr:ABC transporter permease [Rhabdochromatium marinum]MBK1649525.1 ABC transporter permease [Rhabdochromatium marinum]
MRTHWQVTWSVWHALFMREVLARTMNDRMGWFWMLGEPMMFIGFMVSIRSFMGRTREIIGAEFIPWLIIGLTGFFLIRNAITRGMSAIQANKALFAYRQIKPVDPLLVRHAMEGMLQTIVLLILLGLAVLVGMDALPDDMLGVGFMWLSLSLLGLGCALVVSVVVRLIPDLERLIKMITFPLLILSGVILPLNRFPPKMLEYLMYNPIVHGLELLRGSYFSGYHLLAGVSLEYFWQWILITLALGLALHTRYEHRLKAQ